MTTPEYGSYDSMSAYPVQGNGVATDPAANGYGVDPTKKNTLALVGFIISIIGLIGSTPFVLCLGTIIAVIALVLCIVSLAKAKKYAPQNRRRGLAIAGVIISFVGIAIAIASMTLFGYIYNKADLAECNDRPSDQVVQCWQEHADNLQQEIDNQQPAS